MCHKFSQCRRSSANIFNSRYCIYVEIQHEKNVGFGIKRPCSVITILSVIQEPVGPVSVVQGLRPKMRRVDKSWLNSYEQKLRIVKLWALRLILKKPTRILLYLKRKFLFYHNDGFYVLFCYEPRSVDKEGWSLPKVMASLATLVMTTELSYAIYFRWRNGKNIINCLPGIVACFFWVPVD